MYCMRLADDADCKIPGGTKGRTANKTMPPLVRVYQSESNFKLTLFISFKFELKTF